MKDIFCAVGIFGLAAALVFWVFVEDHIHHGGRITPAEQMRERTPWPPPPPIPQTVRASYSKPEMLALPRGDR